MNTTDLGNISEAKFAARLLEVGYKVALPFGSGQHFDMLVEIAGKWRTVQVKTGRIRSGSMRFNVVSVKKDGVSFGYKGDRAVDYFGVYCPDNGTCYLIESKEVSGTTKAYLRVQPPKNGQKKNVMNANMYII